MHTVYTIGHSTRPIDNFIELLRKYSITELVDIRTIPKSRYNPQYNQPELKRSLKDAGISYRYLEELGGFRPEVKDSINDAWHNKSFRNYADYMQMDGFCKGLEELIRMSEVETVVIMCAEAVPWRCHRSLVSDALVVRKIPVCEIIDANNVREHKLTSFAVVNGTQITYPKSDLHKKD